MSLLSRLAVQAARAYGILSARSTNISADYLVVAGGGGGGQGGGGAGGLKTNSVTLSTLNTYSVTVGAGGTAGTNTSAGANGSDSILSGTGITTITSTGGGRGGYFSAVAGASGGSGGGGGGADSGSAGSGGAGTSGQGNAGGTGAVGSTHNGGGGGGGAGATGGNATFNSNGGAGGIGVQSSISGSATYYAGGGSGGCTIATAGGSGGGGAGGASSSAGTAGTANTGGGGGGAGNATGGVAGGAGGSGIVIISYTSATPKFVGGTITTSGGKQIHTFTSSGTLSPITPITASYLVVAGGAGGGTNAGGGGGAGGLQASSTTLYSGATYVVTVGAGGAGGASGGNNAGSNGSNSVVSGTGLTTLTSVGGGGGGKEGSPPDGASGGSGGGGHSNGATIGTGGAGTSGQGYAGGSGATNNSTYRNGGGGGGASAVGATATSGGGGAGGNGTASSISGSSVTYAGGGGGGSQQSSQGGSGGTGGGGAGTGGTGGAAGGSGTTNLGGGGGGGAGGLGAGGAGGSGIVIISYAGSQVFNGGLVTTSGGNTIHTFTSSGALTPLTNNLNNSLRFRSSASAYLNRTPASASNRKTWTWSGWVKKAPIQGSANTLATLMGCTTGSTDSTYLRFGFYQDKFIVGNNSAFFLQSTPLYRDPSAWYHVVVSTDTNQGSASNRMRVYINGNEVTAWSTDQRSTYLTSSVDLAFNQASQHSIGSSLPNAGDYYDGYMTDINFIDGQQLEPYYFGNNDANGVWKPIQYKGTYGTNGFYLNFADTSALTTSSNAGLGKDTSGNGNYWTTNNISITSGSTYDAMTDVPTNTSATVANYCTLNPLESFTNPVPQQANLYVPGTDYSQVKGTFWVSTGKWYYEWVSVGSNLPPYVGVSNASITSNTNVTTSGISWYGHSNSYYKNFTGTSLVATSAISVGDVIGVAFDCDAGTVAYYKNNSLVHTDTTLTPNQLVAPTLIGTFSGGSWSAAAFNFGQRPFAYTPPTGYKALNTYNLPTPTILQGNKYMDATTYSAASPTNRVIVNQAQFKPDLVWIKSRTQAYSHYLFDSNRGVGAGALSSNNTSAQNWDTGTQLSSFNSNGYTISSGDAISDTSAVAWQWQAGQGSTSSNTSGSITSTVSVNTTAGFSVVTYTGAGTSAGTVGHGLGVAPKLIIAKTRTSAQSWVVYHETLGINQLLELNTTGAASTISNYWGSSAPTSTVFGVYTANNIGNNNYLNIPIVAYCWAEIAGYSKFGSYAGNSSTDGPFIYLGFRPKFVIFKDYSNAHSWIMVDSSRNTYNVAGDYLRAESSAVENATYSVANNTAVDFLSNGFKLRNAAVNSGENNGSSNYLYMAWAENPFKNSNAR